MHKLFILFLLLFISSNALGMCDYPFNPPVYCLTYQNIIEKKKIEKYTPFKCAYKFEKMKFIRPAKTYHFDQELNKNTQNKDLEILPAKSQQLQDASWVHSDKCNLKEKVQIVTFLSCYDKYENIPDFLFLTNGKSKQSIKDGWEGKLYEIDCSNQSLLSDKNLKKNTKKPYEGPFSGLLRWFSRFY